MRSNRSHKMLFTAFSQKLGTNPDYIFIMHWFKKGGSELETLHMIETLLAMQPHAKVGLITTMDVKSEWLDRLPPSVIRLEFGRQTAGLSLRRKLHMLVRLLLIARPKVIHVVASRLGWDAYRYYGKILARGSTLLATSFGMEFNWQGPFSFAHSRLPYCKTHVTRVFTDNKTHAEDLHKSLRYPRTKPLFMPVTQRFSMPRTIKRKSLKILWAGRWDLQKRIDILYLIALFSPRHEFHVYGSLVADKKLYGFDIGLLKNLKNVVVRGSFDGFSQTSPREFDLFVYTSAWDGLPNILLEAGACGLPIIAPRVGGVGELINSRTGFLVSESTAVSEYIQYIERISRNPEIARGRAHALQELLKRRHSLKRFRSEYASVLNEIGWGSP